MTIQVNNKDGWLFPEPLSNAIHDIAPDDLSALLMMAEADNQWVENVRQVVINDSPNPPAMLGRLEEVVTGVLK